MKQFYYPLIKLRELRKDGIECFLLTPFVPILKVFLNMSLFVLKTIKLRKFWKQVNIILTCNRKIHCLIS